MIKMPYDPKLELRKVHRRAADGQLGSMAELHDLLIKKGFSFLYQKSKPTFETGRAEYADPLGSKALLQRIEKGKAARWLPPAERSSGMLVKVRTAATPDVWQLILGKKKGK